MADTLVTDTASTDTTATTTAADTGATTATTAPVADADATAVAGATDGTAVVVPETYTLKWPEGSTADPAIVERTAARARALGLSNEAGQSLLDLTVQDLTERQTAEQAAATAFTEAWKPGGEEWTKRNDQWTAEALTDPALGAGDPAKLAQAVEKAQLALTKYGPDLKTYLDETGLGSHPAAIKFLATIGRAMSEGALVNGSPGGAAPKSDAQLLYPSNYDDAGNPKA